MVPGFTTKQGVVVSVTGSACGVVVTGSDPIPTAIPFSVKSTTDVLVGDTVMIAAKGDSYFVLNIMSRA